MAEETCRCAGGNFAREDHLHTCKQRVRGAGFDRHPRIFQNEHPPLGFLGGNEFAGFHHQTLDVVELPDTTGAQRVTGSGVTTFFITFQSGVMWCLADALVIFLPDGFDIVFCPRPFGLGPSARSRAGHAVSGESIKSRPPRSGQSEAGS